MTAEARLKELGIVLPALAKPVANYLPYRLAGNLLFLSGQGPRDERGDAEWQAGCRHQHRGGLSTRSARWPRSPCCNA